LDVTMVCSVADPRVRGVVSHHDPSLLPLFLADIYARLARIVFDSQADWSRQRLQTNDNNEVNYIHTQRQIMMESDSVF
jgi:hypothetical protein